MCREEGAESETPQQMKWLCSFLGIFLSRCWHRWMSVRPWRCPVGLQGETMCSVMGQGRTNYSGRSRCGLEGLEGLMTWAVLTLVLFACSPHRLIFWHPKYSETFHQTTDRQPHLNGMNSTRESHHNPGLQTQKFKTFMLPLHHGATLQSTEAWCFSQRRHLKGSGAGPQLMITFLIKNCFYTKQDIYEFQTANSDIFKFCFIQPKTQSLFGQFAVTSNCHI